MKTTAEIQPIVNRLYETFGSGLPFRVDYFELLRQNGLRRSDITEEITRTAQQHEKACLAEKYRKPKKSLDGNKTDRTISTTEENRLSPRRKYMNVSESDARALLISQGRKRAADPEEFPVDRLQKKLNEKNDKGVWELVADAVDPEDQHLADLFRSIGDALGEGEEVVVKPDDFASARHTLSAVSELNQSEEEPQGESMTTTTLEAPKRKRGRPRKNPLPETTNRVSESEDTHSNGQEQQPVKPAVVTTSIRQPEIHIEEVDQPRWRMATHNLAKQFRDMTRYPHDREIQPKRCALLRDAIRSGLFHGSEWVAAKCRETGETYRINGKHTSNVLCEMYEAEEKFPDVRVWVREFNCQTMADVAQLFASYDAKESARSKNDVLRGFAVTEESTAKLSPRWLGLLTSALAYAEWEGAYNKLSPKEQSLWLLQHTKFVPFAVQLFESDPKGTKHIQRMPVVAAIFKTWQEDRAAADTFWARVADDVQEEKGSVIRTLAQWLLKHKIGAVKATSQSVSAREAYCRCILAWNAWREKEESAARFVEGMETPVAV